MVVPLRLVVVSDSSQSLRSLVSLLEAEFEIVATAADGASAVDLIRHSKPDVAVLDLNTPPGAGIEAIQQLAGQPGLATVICSTETASGTVDAALAAGARGYVFKPRIEEDLVLAVQWAHEGRSFVSGKSRGGGRANHAKFFKELGRRIRELREKGSYTQADMESFGFSTRHWQQIEAGRPTTMTTLLRICGAFKIKLEDLLRGLDQDIYPD